MCQRNPTATPTPTPPLVPPRTHPPRTPFPQHTILLVSHDRAFLNEVCTDIILVQDRRLHYYKGNYDQYEQTREEQAINTKRLYDSYVEKRAHMQEFVDKFRANAKVRD